VNRLNTRPLHITLTLLDRLTRACSCRAPKRFGQPPTMFLDLVGGGLSRGSQLKRSPLGTRPRTSMRILLFYIACCLSVGCDSEHVLASRGITLTHLVPLERPSPAQQAASAALLAPCSFGAPVPGAAVPVAALRVSPGGIRLSGGIRPLSAPDSDSETWATADSSVMILTRITEAGAIAGLAIMDHDLASEGSPCRRRTDRFLAVETRQLWVTRSTPHDTIFAALLEVVQPGAGALHFTILTRSFSQRDALVGMATTLSLGQSPE
jgi:hypothetical protein